jgi:hypothetical protein
MFRSNILVTKCGYVFTNIGVLASMYLDINQHIDDNLLKIEAIIQFSKGEGIILAIDSNSRSTT